MKGAAPRSPTPAATATPARSATPPGRRVGTAAASSSQALIPRYRPGRGGQRQRPVQSGRRHVTGRHGPTHRVRYLAPAAGATVSGTVAVAATASDNVGVATAQFVLDG